MTAPPDFDELAQRLVVALRDHADEIRVLPDVDTMRRTLESLARATPRAPHRVLVAMACAAIVLGGAGVAAAVAGTDRTPSTEVADESMTAAAWAVPFDVPPVVDPPVETTLPPTTSTVPPTTSLVLPRPPAPPIEPGPEVTNEVPLAPAATEPPPPPPTAPPTTAQAPPAASAVPTTIRQPATTIAPTTTVRPTTTTTVPATTTTTTVAFTMKQKWKTSSAAPPFEEFSGTAARGATITITSAYGSGTTTVDQAGNWALRVEFPNAPVNVAFTGKVKTAQGQRTFTFTRV
jgi:hypothetical protein